jgi:hypothetical protein
MTRGALSIVPVLFLVTACSDGPTEPGEVFIEGYVTWLEVGSAVQGAVVSATTGTLVCGTDFVFGGETCSTRTDLVSSDTTDFEGYYRLVTRKCVDVRVRVPSYQRDQIVGDEHEDVCGGQQLDMQVRLRDPRVIIRGTVTSVDGAAIGGVRVSIYSKIDAGQALDYVFTNSFSGGAYSVAATCEGVLYVQATCSETTSQFVEDCNGWMDSERIPVTSDCPAPGEDLLHDQVDFVLDPISE